MQAGSCRPPCRSRAATAPAAGGRPSLCRRPAAPRRVVSCCSSSPDMQLMIDDAVVWASQHGLVVGLGGSAPPAALMHAPLSLLPVPFPEERFLQAKAAQPLFNQLVDAVAGDEAYLATTLAPAAAQDAFTARLLRLLGDSAPARAALAAAGRQVVLGVHRSDYMLDAPSGGFLQVELNTIASSFGCLSTLVSRLHAATLDKLAAQQLQQQPGGASPSSSSGGVALSRLPANHAMQGIAGAMAAAVAAQGGGGVVVMVVQPGERNAYDQQWLQSTLWEEHRLRTVRLTLAQIAATCTVDPADATLRMSDATAVSLVYFRAGYTPNDYPSEAEWEARLLIESSCAAKCPSVAYQLAGAKKVQQDLAAPGVVERFVGQVAGAQLRQLFAGLWPLEDPTAPDTAAVIADAIAQPGAYVLKPQREGGGNNLYGPQLAERLAAGGAGLGAFILMQRILPPPQRSVLVRNGSGGAAESLSELGIYGTWVRKGDQVLVNAEVGHLVRTKASDSNEGGVAAGYAVLDSPYLVRAGEADPIGALLAALEGP